MPNERSEPAASSVRRATGDPDRYLIPRDRVPPALAERLQSGVPGATPRPAATVVLIRPASAGPEVLLLRRPGRSRFAANAWVFPGGAVDPGDAADAVVQRILGPPPPWWGARLGTGPREAVGFLAAALREAWEETGILLAEPRPDADLARRARGELLASTISLGDALESGGLMLDARHLVYIAHWITPEAEPRRYDTRFFLAAVPPDASCELLGAELHESTWITPREAVDAFRAGDLWLLPPTVHTLQRLARHATVEALEADLGAADVPEIVPRMTLTSEGVVIEVPSVR